MLAVCRGGWEGSCLGREGLPSPQLQSWMAWGCPETSEEPVTHGRLQAPYVGAGPGRGSARPEEGSQVCKGDLVKG